MIAAVDTEALLELAWVGPVAALIVSMAWALCIYGFARAADSRRDGRSAAASLYVGVALLAGVAFTGAIAFGLAIIVSK